MVAGTHTGHDSICENVGFDRTEGKKSFDQGKFGPGRQERNAINNGFLVIESPGLVAHLRAACAGTEEPTVVLGAASINFERATVTYGGETFSFPAIGPVPQEVIAAGGAEALIRQQLDQS